MTKAVCKLPLMPTSKAITDFGLVQPTILTGLTWTGTADATELAKLTNGDNMDYYDDSTATCDFAFTAPENYVYVLE